MLLSPYSPLKDQHLHPQVIDVINIIQSIECQEVVYLPYRTLQSAHEPNVTVERLAVIYHNGLRTIGSDLPQVVLAVLYHHGEYIIIQSTTLTTSIYRQHWFASELPPRTHLICSALSLMQRRWQHYPTQRRLMLIYGLGGIHLNDIQTPLSTTCSEICIVPVVSRLSVNDSGISAIHLIHQLLEQRTVTSLHWTQARSLRLRYHKYMTRPSTRVMSYPNLQIERIHPLSIRHLKPESCRSVTTPQSKKMSQHSSTPDMSPLTVQSWTPPVKHVL